MTVVPFPLCSREGCGLYIQPCLHNQVTLRVEGGMAVAHFCPEHLREVFLLVTAYIVGDVDGVDGEVYDELDAPIRGMGVA